MGNLFKTMGENEKAKSFFQKIIQIWRKHILEVDFESIFDYRQPQREELQYEEAKEYIKQILVFFEIEYSPQDTITAECQFVFGLVMLKTGNVIPALEMMQKAHIIYANNLGEFDEKTKEIEEVVRRVEDNMKEHTRE